MLKFYKNCKIRDWVIFGGMVGYCLRDKGEEHFEFVHRNVSANDMNEG